MSIRILISHNILNKLSGIITGNFLQIIFNKYTIPTKNEVFY